MKNFVTAVILLAAVVCAAAACSGVICAVCGEIITLAESGETEKAAAKWSEWRAFISFFEHDAEIDAVDEAVSDMGTESDGGEPIDAKDRASADFIAAVKEILECEKPTAVNLLFIDLHAKMG